MSPARAVAMPFQPTSLMFVALMALVVSLAQRYLLGNPAVAALLAYLALSWTNKYAFALLDQAANGRFHAPVGTVEMLGPFGDARPWVHPVLAVALAVLAAKWGPPTGLLFAAAGALLLPASIAAIAVSSRLIDAINPVAMLQAVRGLGAYYLLLLAGGAFAALLFRALWDWSGGPVPLRVAIGEFVLFGLYTLLGGCVHHRRNELDYLPMESPERTAERAEAARVKERQQAFDEVYGALRVRSTVVATTTLERWLGAQTGATLARDVDALIVQARGWQDAKSLGTVLRTIVTHGVRTRQLAVSLQAVEAALAVSPTFALTDPAEVEAVANQARRSSRRRLAASLLDNYLATRKGEPPPAALLEIRRQLPP